MDSELYWKNFENTGDVLEYLHYKEAQETEQGQQGPAGEQYANGNTGPGASGSKGG